MPRKKVLFVCSRNQWRSPTAETIFRRHPDFDVRSGGTNSNARHQVSQMDLEWADAIMVMEHKHLKRLKSDFPGSLNGKSSYVLDIPDDYQYMDTELIELLKASVPPMLEEESV